MHGAVIRRLGPSRGSHTRLAKLGSLAFPGPSRKDDTAFCARQAGDVSPQKAGLSWAGNYGILNTFLVSEGRRAKAGALSCSP